MCRHSLNKIVKALKALATTGGAGVEVDNEAAGTAKLFRGLKAGVEKFFVDSLGNLTAQAITGTSGAFSGALSAASATISGAAVRGFRDDHWCGVGGTLAVSGATTVQAPTVSANPARKAETDALDTRLDTARRLWPRRPELSSNSLVRRDGRGRRRGRLDRACAVAHQPAPTAASTAPARTTWTRRTALRSAGATVYAETASSFTTSGTATQVGGLTLTATLVTGRAYAIVYEGVLVSAWRRGHHRCPVLRQDRGDSDDGVSDRLRLLPVLQRCRRLRPGVGVHRHPPFPGGGRRFVDVRDDGPRQDFGGHYVAACR
jgi:hypothetical protein